MHLIFELLITAHQLHLSADPSSWPLLLLTVSMATVTNVTIITTTPNPITAPCFTFAQTFSCWPANWLLRNQHAHGTMNAKKVAATPPVISRMIPRLQDTLATSVVEMRIRRVMTIWRIFEKGRFLKKAFSTVSLAMNNSNGRVNYIGFKTIVNMVDGYYFFAGYISMVPVSLPSYPSQKAIVLLQWQNCYPEKNLKYYPCSFP